MSRTIALALAAVVLLALPVRAEEQEPAPVPSPTERLEAEVHRIQGVVEASNRHVRQALERKSWSMWCSAHNAYLMTVTRVVPQVEQAIAGYMLAVLREGGTLDRVAMRVIDGASGYVGSLAKHRAIVSAYGTLARQGVRPDRRDKALELLAAQGVYILGCSSLATPGSRAAPPQTEGESPMCGRIPGSTDAAEHLKKWQYAFLRTQTAEQQVATMEMQLASLPVGAPPREGVEERLAQRKAELAELRKASVDWRKKYYEAGGR